jgi:putative oxidoreductase
MARNTYAAAERPHALSGLPGVALGLLRAVAGLMLMQHGVQKLFGLLGGWQNTPGATAPLVSPSGMTGVLEIAGGLLLAVGLFTRPTALVLAGLLAGAYFLEHASRSFWPIVNRGELTVLYAFVFLLFAAMGGGPLSLDGWRARRRANRRLF